MSRYGKAIVSAYGALWLAARGDGYWIAAKVEPDADWLAMEMVDNVVMDDTEIDAVVYEMPAVEGVM